MASPKTKETNLQPDQKRGLFIALSLTAILVSIIYSYKLRWLGDDIFIAFRYVQHFLAGEGLVYNPGERVEGFTDFLWIMLISLFTKLHFDPMNVTQFLGIASSAGTLIICAVIGHRMAQKKNTFIIPFIVISLALNYDYNVWATSGLETSFYTFLLCAAFFTYFFSALSEVKRLIITGLLLSLAMMTRPDAMLITFGANGLFVCAAFLRKDKIRELARKLLYFNIALLLVYLPYFLWRYHYYGFIFPNTYYVKLGNETLFSKGFYYLWLYFKPHFTAFLALLLPFLVILPLLKDQPLQHLKDYITDRWNAGFITALLMIYAYLLIFIAKVGGDFMHARFVIPAVPFMSFVLFYSLLNYVKTKNLNLILTALLICSFVETKIRMEVFKAPDKNGKIITTLNKDVADERYVYTEYLPIGNDIKAGKAIHNAFAGIDAKMLIRGGQGCLGYFANFRYEQEYHGLTDTLIAHSKIETRGRIGHEKHASGEYLEKKGVTFLFNRSPIFGDEQYRYARINIPPFTFRTELITFNNRIIDQMRERFGKNFEYTDFRDYLDQYIQQNLNKISKEQLKKDYDSFYLYYFMHNDDKARENKFLEALKK